jgi:ABC-type maltose transport system permease subunit
MTKQWKKDWIVFAILLVFTVILFVLIDVFTLKNDREGVSGNGNPGLLFIIPVIPLYIAMLVYVYRISQKYFFSQNNPRLYLGIFIALALACIFGEYQQIQSHLRALGGGPSTPDSVIYHFPWLNQYTNTMFFNLYTYILGILFVLLASLTIARLKRKNR